MIKERNISLVVFVFFFHEVFDNVFKIEDNKDIFKLSNIQHTIKAKFLSNIKFLPFLFSNISLEANKYLFL